MLRQKTRKQKEEYGAEGRQMSSVLHAESAEGKLGLAEHVRFSDRGLQINSSI